MTLIICKINLIYYELFFSEILQMITFGPEPYNLFSNSGCKRINHFVTSQKFKF